VKDLQGIVFGEHGDSMGFGVPARIGTYGVEKIYQMNVEAILPELNSSAALVKQDIRTAADLLKQKYGQFI
jgi:malate/lactate dehydrogenase